MKYRLLRTDKANRQMVEIAAYIAEETGDYETALGLINKIEQALSLLGETPHRGSLPRSEALRKQGHRVLVSGAYLIFYRCDDDKKTVTVTAVIHSKQDYLRVLS